MLLDEIDRELPQDAEYHPKWLSLDINQTRIRLYLRQQHWESAAQLAAASTDLADVQGDRILRVSFRLLRAEALLPLGQLGAATDLAVEAAALTDGSSLTSLGEVARVQGKILAHSGRPAEAADAFARAQRIADVTGNACTAMDIEADWRGAFESRAGEMQAAAPVPGPALLFAAAELVDMAPHVELLGRVAVALLRASGCTRAVALTAAGPGGTCEVLERDGWTEEEARSAGGGSVVTVALGVWRDRRIQLHARPQEDLTSRSALVAVQKLLAGVLALEDLRREQQEQQSLWPVEAPGEDPDGVFVSSQMLEIVRLARKIAPTGLPVLLTGETGTGKEVVARAIHRASTRADRIFLPFNCAAVPRDMLESQLFGHRRGAFTGAAEKFPGVIRGATGGTLFLDEIGELGPDLQPKLLRFLEQQEIQPLGEPQPVKVDVRVVAATNAGLDELVETGRFREDLFYRLNVFRLRLPPLRERREEIPILAHHFLRGSARELNKGRLRLSDEALEYLLVQPWPGNVRQLANEMRRAAALAEADGTLLPGHLSTELRAARRPVAAEQASPTAEEIAIRLDQPLNQVVESIERLMVRRALDRTQGRVEDAARLLGISRKGLFLKRRRWGLGRAS
jgi:DNA-binding NtrC family response regulator